MTGDSHDSPHRVIGIEPLARPGWALIAELSRDGHHAQLRLVTGEGGPSEIVDCHPIDEPSPDARFEDLAIHDSAWAIRHVLWHALSGTPVGCGERDG